MTIIKYGYVCKRTCSGKNGFRNWWLIKQDCRIALKTLYFSKDYFGKKIRLKVELVEENDTN